MRKIGYCILIGALMACTQSRQELLLRKTDEALQVAVQQAKLMAGELQEQTGRLPKSIRNGELETSSSAWWTSGFFPGTLWYLYEYSQDPELRKQAEEYTRRVEDQQYTTDNHDVGFMIFCSYGNAYRVTGDTAWLGPIGQASRSLCTRFRPRVGCIRSWDYTPWSSRWQYPVIIDNMMNLEMLMWSAKKFDRPEFAEIAKTHANTTLKEHFRPDNSSYHVISYDTLNGEVELRNTAQGYSHESAWARGQAWGLYGYTMMFRESGDTIYLTQARKIADYILGHPHLPEDKIPYWDFDAPDIPDALRDASAGAVICSALLELSGYVGPEDAARYREAAETQLETLCSSRYLARPGENAGFLLKHSVGNLPGKTEVDVPLTYADYYFVEAMLRYRELCKK